MLYKFFLAIRLYYTSCRIFKGTETTTPLRILFIFATVVTVAHTAI